MNGGQHQSPRPCLSTSVPRSTALTTDDGGSSILRQMVAFTTDGLSAALRPDDCSLDYFHRSKAVVHRQPPERLKWVESGPTAFKIGNVEADVNRMTDPDHLSAIQLAGHETMFTLSSS